MKCKLFSLFIIATLLLSGCAAPAPSEEEQPPAAQQSEEQYFRLVCSSRVDFPVAEDLSPYRTDYLYSGDGSLRSEEGAYTNNAGPGHSQTYTYNDQGLLIRSQAVSEAGESVLTYEYDDEGRRTKRVGVTYGADLGGITLYEYDEQGRCEVVTTTSYMGADPAAYTPENAYHTEQRIFEYGYDGTLGKLTHLYDGEIYWTYTFSYDGQQNLTQIICLEQDGTINTTNLTYNDKGQCIKAESKFFTNEYAYDEDGNIIEEKQTQNGSLTYIQEYTYRAFATVNPHSAKADTPMNLLLSDFDPYQ